MSKATPLEQLEIIKRNAAEIITEDDLVKKLERSCRTGKPLKCKLGFDPSAPDLHLGHAVVLHKMRDFQDLGHEIIIILGDFTGRIGDPTGRSETRRQLSEEEVAANARTYRDQVFNILDPDKTQLVFNSSWLSALDFASVIRLASNYTVARMLEREDFSRRYREGFPIGIHEFFYPLMQGYDSVAIEADVELGATEQKFNLIMGRHLQREYGQEPQVSLTTPILVGTDGVQKMSKSLNNYIGITEPPSEMYGKVMSIPDTAVEEYLNLASGLPESEIRNMIAGLTDGTLHPRDIKMTLAREVVARYHNRETTLLAEEEFRRVFQQRELPSQIPLLTLDHDKWSPDAEIVPLLVASGMANTNSEARRLIRQGGIRLNGIKVEDTDRKVNLREEALLQAGRRKFVRVVIGNYN